VPFGSSGYVMHYEIEPRVERVVILAARQQLEGERG
jgi:hypothetical protein